MTALLVSELSDAYTMSLGLLERGAAEAALSYLVPVLARVRETIEPTAWKQVAFALSQHRVHERFHEDPYIRAAATKPRGYAGDAHTLDFVYRYRGPDSDVTPLGRELLAKSTEAQIARAVRARCDHIASLIGGQLRERPDSTILSVACGHMRELHKLPSQFLLSARLLGVDQDPTTVACLRGIHGGCVASAQVSVREIVTHRADLPRADLIYASGLYDYLDRKIAVALSRALVARLRPGGKLVILNLTPANEEIAFMEAIMDWWMVYRDAAAMGELARLITDCKPEFSARTYDLADGRMMCTEITRL